MDRPESFPFDWIEPGEFTYCHCGWRLTVGGRACKKCAYQGPTMTWAWPWASRDDPAPPTIVCAEWPAASKRADEEHAVLSAWRDTIAGLRRAAGMPPLFWMKREQTRPAGV